MELISKAELVQLGIGHPYEGKESAWRDRYIWPLNVCVEGTCVTIEGGSPTKKNYVSLVDVVGGRKVSVFVGHSVTPGTISSLLR